MGRKHAARAFQQRDRRLVASDIGIVLLETGDTGHAERLLRATLAELEVVLPPGTRQGAAERR